MKMNKRGFTIQQLAPIAIAFVVVAVTIGIGASVLENVEETQCSEFWNESDAQNPFCATTANNSLETTTYGGNATISGMSAMDTLADWLPTIGVIVAAAVVIGIIVAYFRF